MAKQSTLDKFTSAGATAIDSSAASRLGPNKAALLAAITQSHDMLDTKICAVGSEDLQNTVDRIADAESTVSVVVDSVMALQQKVHKVTVMTKELAMRVEDAEGGACCNNL
ncbi:hypothetical protein NDU88_006001 [Pleurodeles waltl]|uniref:BLOC-1-related complex subunit 7 n=1 Tax=Pleurodeles waltl TaxID=8319 RepID=A0AAV7WEZ3_PLEWA|nr:hypothetical protein NDU88_006001 [Pleurodeles waltl]